MSVAGPPPRYARLGRIARSVVALVGAALCLAGVVWETLAVPATYWRLERDVILLMGGLLIAAAWAARRAGPRLSIALACGAIALAALLAAAAHSPQTGETSLSLVWPRRAWNSPRNWADIVIENHDRRFGYAARAGQTQRQSHETDYDVTYHYDAEGWRVMPASDATAEQRPLLFLGCSFTFGMGVDDDQHFPWLLASRAWPGQRVLNHAISGWGTAHSMLALDEALRREPPPRAVFYGYITSHRGRNYLSKGWRQMQRVDFPYFEINDHDQLEFRGIVPANRGTWESSPELTEREHEITYRLIDEMDARCRERAATFVLLFLETMQGGDAVMRRLQSEGRVHVLDLCTLSDDTYPTDWHPTARWHQTIASAIAGAPEIAEWTGLPELHRLGVLRPAGQRWRLAICQCGAKASKRWLPGDEVAQQAGGVLRVENIELSRSPQTWDAELHRGLFALDAGQRCQVRMRLRADRPRWVTVNVRSNENTTRPAKQVELTPVWQSFDDQFTAQQPERGLYVAIGLGHDATPIEVTGLRVLVEGQAVISRMEDEE